MYDALRVSACYALCIFAAWLIVVQVREFWIAWYNGVTLRMSMVTKASVGLQILVNLAAMVLALWAA